MHTPCNCFIFQFHLWDFCTALHFWDDVNRAGALQYSRHGEGCEHKHLGLPDSLKHVAVGYRPGYPPPNRVHNNRFLPPRLLHTVHIQIHTRRAASRGGPGATTVPGVGGEERDSSRAPLSRPFLSLPSRRICSLVPVSSGTCGLQGVQALSSRATTLRGCSATRACARTWYSPALAGAEREPRGSGAATSAAVAVAVAARSR